MSDETVGIRVQVRDADRARQELHSTGDAVASVGDGADGATHATGKLGAALSKLGPIGAAAGAAIAAGLGLGMSTLMDRQNAGLKLQQQLGLDDSSAALAGKDAGKVFSQNYGDSISDVGDAMRVSIQNGFGMIDDGSEQQAAKWILNLKSAFGADSQGIGAAVGQMLRTGMAKNANDAFNILTRGFQVGNDKAGDLLDTVNEYSTQFRDMGLTGRDMMGLIQQGLKGGARDSDLVADAFKELNIRVKSLDTNAVPALQKLGLNANHMAEAFSKGGPKAKQALHEIMAKLHDVKDPAERAQLSMKLFGTQSEDLAGALGKIDLDTAAKGFTKVDGAAKRLDDTTSKGLTNNLEYLRRQVLAGIADFIEQKLKPAFDKFAGWLIGLKKYVPEVKREFDQVVHSLARLEPTVNAIWRVFKKVFGVEMKVLFAGIKLEIRVFAAAFNWIVTAVNDTSHWVKKAFGDTRDWLKGAAHDISGFFGAIPDGLKGAFDSVLHWVGDRINNAIDLMNMVIDLYNKIPGAPNIDDIAHVSFGSDSVANGGSTPSINVDPSQYRSTTSLHDVTGGNQGATAVVASSAATRRASAGSNGIAPVFHVNIHASDAGVEHLTRSVIDRVEVQAAHK